MALGEADGARVQRIGQLQRCDGSPLAREVVAEDRDVDRVAPGIVAVEVERLVPFEELVVRASHVRGVQAGLHPGGGVIDPSVFHVVVPDDVPAAGGPHHHHLVHVPGDVVFEKVVGRVPGERKSVTASARRRRLRAVDVRVADDAPERGVDADALAVLEVGFDVLDPAVGRGVHLEISLAGAPSVEVEVLDPRRFDCGDHGPVVRVRQARELGGEGRLEIDVERRGEGDRAAADGLDLHHLTDGPVRTREPGP